MSVTLLNGCMTGRKEMVMVWGTWEGLEMMVITRPDKGDGERMNIYPLFFLGIYLDLVKSPSSPRGWLAGYSRKLYLQYRNL